MRTWSHTPWNLRQALRERASVVDLGLTWSGPTRAALKALGAYRHDGRWATAWKHHPLTVAAGERRLRSHSRTSAADVVLEIGDLARFDQPFLLYQDLSFDMVIERLVDGTGSGARMPGLSESRIRRLADRQRLIYDRCAAVLTMSQWTADHLVRVTGVPADRVHVVPPGANALPDGPVRADRPRPRRRLLFVGKDFQGKAGDVVVEALAVLRREVDPAFRLTIAGPAAYQGEVPPGVRFLGRLPLEEVGSLYAEHDLFVMPSRFEAFGIAFVEALAHGIPCIARHDCAMPELVRSGANGGLVESDDPIELAAKIMSVINDDAIYANTERESAEVIARYQWSRAADDVVRIIGAL
ncbi:glycosyltransferase family 4 protein [Actinokineospora xionganensis]|nr:glycosyltransferase family 4 protein [Actinokineospora xionganensis]